MGLTAMSERDLQRIEVLSKVVERRLQFLQGKRIGFPRARYSAFGISVGHSRRARSSLEHPLR